MLLAYFIVTKKKKKKHFGTKLDAGRHTRTRTSQNIYYYSSLPLLAVIYAIFHLPNGWIHKCLIREEHRKFKKIH